MTVSDYSRLLLFQFMTGSCFFFCFVVVVVVVVVVVDFALFCFFVLGW